MNETLKKGEREHPDLLRNSLFAICMTTPSETAIKSTEVDKTTVTATTNLTGMVL